MYNFILARGFSDDHVAIMRRVALIVGGLGVFAGSAYFANQLTKKKEDPSFSLKELGYIPQQEGIKIFNKIAPKYDSKVR
jgi:hypothetical protein